MLRTSGQALTAFDFEVLNIDEPGPLDDVWVGSPASNAGLGSADQLTQVDGQPYAAELLAKAAREAEGNSKIITLTAARDDETAAYESITMAARSMRCWSGMVIQTA